MVFAQLRSAVILFLVLTVLTGIVYPLVVTGIGQMLFQHQAEGSLIVNKEGKVLGSSLIGQEFTEAKYFWGRPSATNPAYNPSASSGSNLGPSNPLLVEKVQQRINALKALDPDNHAPIPVDLVTSSASGLDPHISVAAANYQLGRVARARHMEAQMLQSLVKQHTQGLMVNVLTLNLALDEQHKGS